MKKKFPVWLGWCLLLLAMTVAGGWWWRHYHHSNHPHPIEKTPLERSLGMVSDTDSTLANRDSTIQRTDNVSAENAGFVMLSEVAPEILQEIRYYSSYNFVGTRIDGYEEPVALLTREAAVALKAVNDDLMQQGYRLKVYDAYRPMRAVRHFRRWAADLNDTLMKADFYPNLPKSVLFHKGYISSRSGHARGSTVDLTIVHLTTNQDVDMGGTFDLLDPRSHPLRHEYVTDQQYQNRMILRNAMTRHGFKAIGTEWWHFTLLNEPYPDTFFDFPVKSL